MKLLKKLLPVATVASTAAIVAPIVTSCGASKTFACTMNAEGEQDKYYEATIEPKAKDSSITDVAKGQEVYFADIEKNKMILVDDILFSQFGQTQKMMGLNEEGETIE
ncbi:MAG: hypothetical protein MJ201_02980 [Mycoplasmoidaceae bacterium]|nr:hypothetical protein [Mycoplasmoidaceae bacterium]